MRVYVYHADSPVLPRIHSLSPLPNYPCVQESPGVLGALLLDGPTPSTSCLVVLLQDSVRCIYANL